MKVKLDEENFDEAEAQAYRAWSATTVPSDITPLFSDPSLTSISASSPPFDRLLAALARFAQTHGVLPLTSTLPDMKADTTHYIKLQNLYKKRSEEEKAEFRKLVVGDIDNALVDSFVKNAHALKVLKGKQLGTFDEDKDAIGAHFTSRGQPLFAELSLCSQCRFGVTEAGGDSLRTSRAVSVRRHAPGDCTVRRES